MEQKENKTFSTGSGIPLKSIYTPDDIKGFEYSRDLGNPGEEPFTRGIFPQMYRSRPWGIKQLFGHGTVEEMNKRFRLALERGQTRLSFAPDNATCYGLDIDDHRVSPADTGVMGAAINTIQDCDVMYKDIPLDKVHIDFLSSAPNQAPFLALYIALYKDRGFDFSEMRGSCHNDLVFAYVSSMIRDPIPPSAAVRLTGDMVEWSVENAPRWVVLGTNPGYNARESGCTAFEELALGFANAICQIDEVLKRGKLGIDDFGRGIGFHLSSDSDFFEEIAKYRAGRRIWCKLAKERYGAKDEQILKYRFHVQVAGSSLTYNQPLNNISRIAYQVMAAALGGAQSITPNSYLEAICEPTEESELISVRTQQIAQFETNITNVVDPLGGSYYLEWLTDEIERRAWSYLEKIEELGGLVKVIESGWIHNEFASRMMDNFVKKMQGKNKKVGVSCFRMEKEPYKFKVLDTPRGTYEIQKERIMEFKRDRDNGKVKKNLEEIRKRAVDGGNVMSALINAAEERATLGEMCEVFREEFGRFDFPMPS